MYSLVVVISSLKFNVERQHLNHITATDTFYGIFTVSYTKHLHSIRAKFIPSFITITVFLNDKLLHLVTVRWIFYDYRYSNET